jgi:hypothetical protein
VDLWRQLDAALGLGMPDLDWKTTERPFRRLARWTKPCSNQVALDFRVGLLLCCYSQVFGYLQLRGVIILRMLRVQAEHLGPDSSLTPL